MKKTWAYGAHRFTTTEALPSLAAQLARDAERVAAQRARATRARALTPSRVFEVQRMQESFLRMQRALGSFERFDLRQLVRAWPLPLIGDAAISFPRHTLSFVVSY